MSKAFLIVGCTGSGKSTFVRNAIKNINENALMLYDVNAEYSDLYKRPLLEFEEFAENATKVHNAVIVFEEATIFLDARSSNEYLIDVLVKKRHRKNTIFLVFHSLSDVPLYIFRKCTHVVLFKTNDSVSIVESRFKNTRLTELFLKLQAAPWIDTKKKDEQGKKVVYSPSEMFDIYNVNIDA